MKSEFHTYEDIKQSIKRLNELSWPKFQENDNPYEHTVKIDSVLHQEFGTLINLSYTFYQSEFTYSIFRARKISPPINPSLIVEHSYPPPSFVSLGRCNFPHYPVFYCANDALTALFETVRNNFEKGEFYALSKWQLIDSKEPFDVEYFLKPTIIDKKIQFKAKDKVLLEGDFEIQGLTESQIKGLEEQMAYLQNLFIQDDNYSLSASLAHRRLYELTEKPPKIIVYPSVKRDANGINMAINPNFAENNLRLSRVYIVEVIDYNEILKDVLFSPKMIGIFKDSSVKWQSADLDKREILELVKEDFKDLPIGKSAKKIFYDNR